MLVVTEHGPYVSPDAVSYIGTARGLAAGDGFTTPPGTPPVGHFAPLYPVVLAAGDVLGLDPVEGARWLNALLLGASVLVVGLVLRRSTGQWWPGLAGGALVVFATDVLAYYSSALSDPMFVLLCVLALATLAEYLQRRNASLLGAATLMTSLALLTRYVGVALLGTGVIVLVAFGTGRRWRGALEAAAFSLAIVPVGSWVLWARGAHGQGSEGELVWHSFGARDIERGVENVLEWVVPDWLPWWIGIAIVAGAIVLFVWAARSDRRDAEETAAGARHLPVVCAVFAGAYVAVLVLDLLLIDASALLDKRLLLPLHVIAIVGILALARREVMNGALRVVTAGVLAMLVLLQIAETTTWVRDSVSDGGARRGGYTSSVWSESPLVALVRNLPLDVPVYTNGPDAIWFLTGRTTRTVPPEKDYLTGQPNPRYRAELTQMAEELRNRHAKVIYFSAIKSRPFLPTEEELRRAMPLREASSDQIGTIYESTL